MNIFLKIGIEIVLLFLAVINFKQAQKYQKNIGFLSDSMNDAEKDYSIRAGYARAFVLFFLAVLFFFIVCV